MKRRRQATTMMSFHRILLLCCVVLSDDAATAFSTPWHEGRTKAQPLHSTTSPDLPPLPKKIEEESNFWRSVVRIREDNDDRRIPCDPSLDAEGPLPFGAYQILGKSEYEPKPTCRLSIAVDTTTTRQSNDIDLTRALHRFIDCGFTTFQLMDEQDELTCRRLKADTPETVLNTCQFVIPFKTPSTSILAQPSIVRDNVLQALHRTGGDCIDTLQLECMYAVLCVIYHASYLTSFYFL